MQRYEVKLPMSDGRTATIVHDSMMDATHAEMSVRGKVRRSLERTRSITEAAATLRLAPADLAAVLEANEDLWPRVEVDSSYSAPAPEIVCRVRSRRRGADAEWGAWTQHTGRDVGECIAAHVVATMGNGTVGGLDWVTTGGSVERDGDWRRYVSRSRGYETSWIRVDVEVTAEGLSNTKKQRAWAARPGC